MVTVAIIEDQRFMRDMLAAALQREGFEVLTAENGRDAGRQLAGQEVDVVVTDIFMPEGDGIEVLRELGRRPRRPPVIAMSGGCDHMETDFLHVAGMLGAAMTLAKPFPVGDLVKAIRLLTARTPTA